MLDQQGLKHTGIAEFTDGRIATNDLGVVFTTEFERSSSVIEPKEGTRVEVSIDQGAIVAGKRRESVCKVELELKQGALAPLFDLAEKLVALPDVRIEAVSKAQRGYRTVARVRPAPVKAIRDRLTGSADVDTVFKTLAFGCIAPMQANEHGVLHSREIEYVYQARVALRRLRTVFSVFSTAIPKSPFSGQLAWLRGTGRKLAEARDWDVFVSEFLPDAANNVTDRSVLAELARTTERLRAEARRRVRTKLVSADGAVLNSVCEPVVEISPRA
ncbi:MAG: CHAD domain-containing protein [Betaproteobacteria bacterium]|nr:MAG: CHAD domain-containing protein [Betaproteobacteria bacterium]